MNQTKLVYEFGPYRLDADERCLLCAGQAVPLAPKSFDLLLALVESHGHVVEKEELLRKVWPNTFVEEANLYYSISRIREALGDGENGQHYIETRPKRGYLFIADVQVMRSESARLTEPVLAVSDEACPDATPEPEGVTAQPPPTKPKWRRWLWLAVAPPVIFLALLATRRWSPVQRAPQFLAPEEQLQEMRQVSSGVTGAAKPMFSPDGKVVLYVSNGNLYLAPLSGGEDLQITKDIYATGDRPVFTADGSAVVFSGHRGGQDGSRLPDLWLVPSLGGTPKLFLTTASGAGFSPDGKQVAYTKHLTGRRPLWVCPVSNLEEFRELSEVGFSPRWSPNGKWIAFSTSDPNGGGGVIWVVSADSFSERRQVTTEPRQLYGLTWSADGESIIFATGVPGNIHLFQVPLDGLPPKPLSSGAGDYVSPTVSPNGETLAFAHTNQAQDLMLAEGVGNHDSEALTRGEYHLWLRLSPSGERVVSVVQRRDFNEYLDLVDLRTKKLRRRVSDRPAKHPCWLDEDRVTYLSPDRAAKATEVRVVDLTTGVNSVLTRFPGEADWLAVNPDRKRLAVVLKLPGGKRSVLLRDLVQNQERFFDSQAS